MKSYIYALLDPRGTKTAYVGRTINQKLRCKRHLKGEKGNYQKNQVWLKELEGLNKTIFYYTLEETDQEHEAQKEAFWIDELESMGFNLLNIAKVNPLSRTARRIERQDSKEELEKIARERAEHAAYVVDLNKRAEEWHTQALISWEKQQAQEAILAEERQKQALKRAKHDRIEAMIMWPVFWIFFAATVFMIYKGAERVWLLYFQ